MIKYIITGLTILSLTACSLDIKNEQEITGDNIINTTQKAMSVLAQAYRTLPIDTKTFTVLSEDLQPTYLIEYNSDDKLYYNWEERTLKVQAQSLWDSYYSTIAHLNVIINTEQNIQDKGNDWNYVKGNALALKAFSYFELLQLYSPRYTPESLGVLKKDNLNIENNKRLTQIESIEYINSMLTQAIELTKNYQSQQVYFITLNAMLQLEAKIALYTKQYDKSEALAKAILAKASPLPASKEEYSAIWTNKNNTPTNQIYWAYDYNKNPNNYLVYSDANGDIMQINYLNKYTESDIRHSVSQIFYEMKGQSGANQPRALLGKYKTNYADKEQKKIVLARNTETHFILIESLVEQNKLKEATERLNEFLTSVQSDLINENQTQQSLRLIFRAEKQKEFIGEHINFFDLKRWNTSITRYLPDSNKKLSTIDSSDYRWTWPIPNSEIRYNTNITQNEGWQTVE